MACPLQTKITLALVTIDAWFAVWKLLARHNTIIEAYPILLVRFFDIAQAAATLTDIAIYAILTIT